MPERRPLHTLPMLLAMLVACFGIVGNAHSAERVMAFKGTLTSYLVGLGYIEIPDVPIGSTIRGQIRYDDSTPDLDPSSGIGVYEAQSLSVAFDGLEMLHTAAAATGRIEITDDEVDPPILRDEIRVLKALGEPDNLPIPSLDALVVGVNMVLQEESNPAPTVISGDALPVVLPPLSGFTDGRSLGILIYYPSSLATSMTSSVTHFGTPGTPDLPLFPETSTVGSNGVATWTFTARGIPLCLVGCWVDPPAADGFVYTMTNADRFTGIMDFPSGFGDALEVRVDGNLVGTFGPGDFVDFTSFPGGGVTSFQVMEISPPASTSLAEGFPLELAMTSTNATFEMTSIPAAPPVSGLPGLLSTGGLLAIALAIASTRRFATA